MIGDGEHNSPTPAVSSKQSLRDMLAQAVANTAGAVPVQKVADGATGVPTSTRAAMGSASTSPDQPPSAYQVATAIVAAARELGADPIRLAEGATTMGGRFADHGLPRARAYAACAIREVFPHNGSTAIGRWVGAKNNSSYLSTFDAQRRGGYVKWWDERLYRRVVLRLQTTPREAS